MKTNPRANGFFLENYTARFVAFGLLAILPLCALACSHGQKPAKAAVNPDGIYTLVSVDGKTVPCTINHEGTAMDVRSGTFTITTNGQCVSVMTVSVGGRKDVRIETHATYKLKDSELTMKWEKAGKTKGRVADETFTMTNESMAYVYKK